MLEAQEGSLAIARAVALTRPGVVAAYPITPQTHIVENLSELVADGSLQCEFVSVESEFSAASVILGAAVAGSRAYTATSSQGLLLMAEVLFNIAGLRVPVTMTCANRAIGAPLNIWNDHSDSMALRDCGWIQLYCANNQEAVDTTIQAARIAEATELPVMVCLDGFTLTHTMEPIDIPDASLVDDFLPPYHFINTLDVKRPFSFGTLVDPAFYTEVRHSHHIAMQRALPIIEAIDCDWKRLSGRSAGGLVECIGPKNAETAILCLGSIASTLRESLAALPEESAKIIKLRSFRPFPTEALRKTLTGVKRLIVLERAFSPGFGGIVGSEIRATLLDQKVPPKVFNFAVGLGGRDMPIELLSEILAATHDTKPDLFSIFDLHPEKLPPDDR